MRSFLNGWRGIAEEKISQKRLGLGNKPAFKNDHSATELAANTYSYFHSSKNRQFQAKSKSESTLGADNHFGYVVWPVIIFVHAAAETLPAGTISEAISCLQQYWNPQRHAFCAWKMFPGNNDIYYDDNAHAAQALISAYEATREKKYLQQAKAILTHLIMPSAQQDGGVPWHTNNPNCRNACSTGPAAVAALRLAALEQDDRLVAFADRALGWLVSTLRDPQDGLIWDSLVFGADGSPNINKMKWTYNTGFAIHGFTLLFEKTGNPAHLQTAVRLAEAALDPENSMFDKTLPKPSERMYSDSSFFLHHLVDGYRVLSKHALTVRLGSEIRRIAAFGREFMFDHADGLYFRGSCPYSISEGSRARFNQKFGVDKELTVNNQERDEQGKLCKTLIGCAAWARILHAAEGI
ncbi:uncharacterized protein L3040_006919 [Drepanopeziza brunnea f. sp. 'multigermtubi']|uniref:Glycosyl hydrolase n=1 Tax=Marssonina brunnea f. sp. multigermtubi (strain MB_m1) TaxID=1072389 RepID=K1WKJ9_MARBU|nr:uncharacterized protein MBM_08996 [Drepanopeziza brunnea f. sp. 'multigermtubi' MB_m1]EKD12767.1 hypothetical protein MBM_08996 [Drepanopeziza brunnea f. sp. 'multigermtubi' MB_m1]KAJ5038048.1 hypothetical protein L3040_006919 [Drepanopeziza brunnea f. sp. 'multigermtubi']